MPLSKALHQPKSLRKCPNKHQLRRQTATQSQKPLPSLMCFFQGMDKKSLLSVLDMMKIQFVYPKNKECDEETYGGHVRGRLEELAKMFR